MFFAVTTPWAVISGAADTRLAEDMPITSDEAERKSLLNMESSHFLGFTWRTSRLARLFSVCAPGYIGTRDRAGHRLHRFLADEGPFSVRTAPIHPEPVNKGCLNPSPCELS